MTSGFKKNFLNEFYKQDLYNTVLRLLIWSCENMLKDCNLKGTNIPNHEEQIRNYLLEHYLRNITFRESVGIKNVPVQFQAEIPVNYNDVTNSYEGRVDIQVVSEEWLYGNQNAYFTIECKRLDGTKTLNEKYVRQGIFRFIGNNPKYPSYANKNIMLGFIIKKRKFMDIVNSINDIHLQELKDYITQNITPVENSGNYCLCESSYISQLILNHLFYNFSDIIAYK